jgi:hypothetical protein
MLHNIKDKCSHYLQTSVDEERVCAVLQTAHDFHIDDLRTNALKFILNIGSIKKCSQLVTRVSKISHIIR